MDGEMELLTYLSENIKMGKESLEALVAKLEHTDNKIKPCIERALTTYKKYDKKCKELMGEEDTKEKHGNLFAVLMTKMSTNANFAKDNSDSHIADMMIQGYNMGILDITKKLKKYKNELSDDVTKLACEYKEMMENHLEEMKEYL